MGRQWREPLPACSFFCLNFACSALTTPAFVLSSLSTSQREKIYLINNLKILSPGEAYGAVQILVKYRG
jgi:hypothetical protein